MAINFDSSPKPGGAGRRQEKLANELEEVDVGNGDVGDFDADKVDLDMADPVVVATRLIEELYAALVQRADYPQLDHEQSHAFLSGVDATALSLQEISSLKLESAADQRLSSLLDRAVTALQVKQASLVVKGKSMFSLVGRGTGMRSHTEARAKSSGIGQRAAAKEIRIGETLAVNSTAQAAVSKGELGLEQVDILSRAVTKYEELTGKKLSSSENSTVVTLGKGRTPEQYAVDVKKYLDSRDPEAHDKSHRRQHLERYFNMSMGPDGAHFRGFLDSSAAQFLRAALDGAMGKPAVGDERSFYQRQADALVTVAKTSLNSGELKPSAHMPPHVSLIVSQEALGLAERELVRRDRVHKELQRRGLTGVDQLRNQLEDKAGYLGALAGTTADSCDEHGVSEGDVNVGKVNAGKVNAGKSSVGGPASGRQAVVEPEEFDINLLEPVAMDPIEYSDGTTVALAEVSRLLCDCRVTRIALGAKALPTNLGRTVRVYSKEHRVAVETRDGTCRFEGCGTIPKYCEVHHIGWWKRDNGETSLDNAVLVCLFHHGQIHNGSLEVIMGSDGLPNVVVTGSVSGLGARSLAGNVSGAIVEASGKAASNPVHGGISVEPGLDSGSNVVEPGLAPSRNPVQQITPPSRNLAEQSLLSIPETQVGRVNNQKVKHNMPRPGLGRRDRPRKAPMANAGIDLFDAVDSS